MTYFNDRDITSLSDDEVVTLATRKAHDIEDLEARDKATRKENDNSRRMADLSLGELIALALHPDAVIAAVVATTTFTPGALRERAAVYNASLNGLAMDRLLDLPLSYSNHRTIVGIRVKQVGAGPKPIHERIDAAERSIARNDGVFVGDDTFYDEASLLPPPNSFERSLKCLEHDPAFRKKKLTSGGADRLRRVVAKHDAEEDDDPPPSPPHPRPITLAELVMNVTDDLNRVVDKLWDTNGMPPIVVRELENWEQKIAVIKDLASARA